MAILQSQIDAVPDYSDESLLRMYRKALMDIAASGQSYAVEGQSLTHSDLDKVKGMIEWLEGRIASNAANDFGNPLGLIHARTARAS